MAEVRDVPVHTNRKYGVTEEKTIKNVVYCMELTFHFPLGIPPSFNLFHHPEDVCILRFSLFPREPAGQAITSRKQANQVSLPGTYDLTQRN
jgi:hypothetical protein